MSKKPVSTPEHDEDLGPVLDAQGAPVESSDPLETTRVLEFTDAASGNQYKAKVDLIGVGRGLDRGYGIAQLKCVREAGFSDAEAGELEKIDTSDPRVEKLLELQATAPRLRLAEAAIAAAAFVKWNAPAPAPTEDDLFRKGGIYAAYTEALMAIYGPTARRSEADAATT